MDDQRENAPRLDYATPPEPPIVPERSNVLPILMSVAGVIVFVRGAFESHPPARSNTMLFGFALIFYAVIIRFWRVRLF